LTEILKQTLEATYTKKGSTLKAKEKVAADEPLFATKKVSAQFLFMVLLKMKNRIC